LRGVYATRSQRKRDFANNSRALPENNILVLFSVFLFSLQKYCKRVASPLLLLEHHVVWLGNLFEIVNNFDAPIHCRVGVKYFCSWDDSARYEPAKSEG
jgi:hypothetical protein